MQSHSGHDGATLGAQEISGDSFQFWVQSAACLIHCSTMKETCRSSFARIRLPFFFASVLVLDLVFKGPSKLLFPSYNCPFPSCFQREESDKSGVVSFPIVSSCDGDSLCAEIEGTLLLTAGRLAKLQATKDNKEIPMYLRNKHALGGVQILVGYADV